MIWALTSLERYLDDMTKTFDVCLNGRNKFTENKEKKKNKKRKETRLKTVGTESWFGITERRLSLFSFSFRDKNTSYYGKRQRSSVRVRPGLTASSSVGRAQSLYFLASPINRKAMVQ